MFNPYFYYLCTPYSKYPKGLEAAEEAASKWGAFLLCSGIPTFGPIIHGDRIKNSIIKFGKKERIDSKIWLELDRGFIEKSAGLIIVKEETWDDSVGIQQEIKWAHSKRKPIYFINIENSLMDIFDILDTRVDILKPIGEIGKRARNAWLAILNLKEGKISEDLCKEIIIQGFV